MSLVLEGLLMRVLMVLLLLCALLSLHEDLLADELLLLLRGVVGVGEVHVASDRTNASLGLEQCLKSIQLCNLMRGQESPSWAAGSSHCVLVSRLVQVRLADLSHSVHLLQFSTSSTPLQDPMVLLGIHIQWLLIATAGLLALTTRRCFSTAGWVWRQRKMRLMLMVHLWWVWRTLQLVMRLVGLLRMRVRVAKVLRGTALRMRGRRSGRALRCHHSHSKLLLLKVRVPSIWVLAVDDSLLVRLLLLWWLQLLLVVEHRFFRLSIVVGCGWRRTVLDYWWAHDS